MQIPVRIVLVETSHPGNIGASARAMKTMGLSDLTLVSPRAFPHADATARASGADDLLVNARVVGSLEEAIADCGFVVGASARARSVAWPTMDPGPAAALVRECAQTNGVALVFGPEQSGLTNDHLALCQKLVTIPTQDAFASLNLAMAVQVLCYELRLAWLAHEAAGDSQTEAFERKSAEEGSGNGNRNRNRNRNRNENGICLAGDPDLPVARQQSAEQGGNQVPLATAAELEYFFGHLEQTLTDAGFLRTDHPHQLNLKLRRIFQRASLDRNDVNILRGVLTALQPSKRQDSD